MSIPPRVTVPEIPSSSAPAKRATVVGVWSRSPDARIVPSSAAPANNVVRIGHAFRPPNASRYRATPHPLRAALAPDRLSRARASPFARPGSFASSVRHFCEKLVAGPEAATSTDCEDRGPHAAEAEPSSARFHHAVEVGFRRAAAPAPTSRQRPQPRALRLHLQCLRIVVPQIAFLYGHQFVQIGDNVVILRIDCRDNIGRV